MGRRKVNREELKKNSSTAKEVKLDLEKIDDKSIDINEGIEILNNQKAKEKKERQERLNSVAKEKVQYKFNKNIIIIAVLATALIIFLFLEFAPIFGINLNKQVQLSEDNKIDIITSSDDIYDTYMSELLVYSNHKIYTYNKHLKKTWEYNLAEQFTPSIYIKDRFIAVTNNSTGNIYLFEDKKETINMKVEGKISKLYFDKNGNFAVDYSTNEYKKVIGVYDKNGNLLYNTYPNTKSIIELELIDNAKKVLLVEANSNSFKIGLSIYLIDSTSSEGTMKEVANIDNCFAYDFKMIKDDLLILLDSKIIKCNINTGNIEQIRAYDSNQMLYVGLSNNYYFAIEKELNDSDNYIFSTLRFDNSNIGNLELRLSPKIVKNNNLLSCIVHQNDVQVVNKWGIETKSILINSAPEDVVLFGLKSIALIYTNKIYIVNL